MLVNGLISWANVLIYFQLPDWFEDFDDSLEEKEDDTPSDRAIKRFFKGDDEYRNKRLKILPYLVDGPRKYSSR